jgi:hypothetical protein
MPNTSQNKLLIGHQDQADKPIYLLANGSVECGRYCYNGRHQQKFKQYYREIVDTDIARPKNGTVDVSDVAYWDAIDVYDRYVCQKWVKSVSAGKLKRFADETYVRIRLKDIETEFKHATRARWLREFRARSGDPSRPNNVWEIF